MIKLLAAFLLTFAVSFAALEEKWPAKGPPIKVHGRLWVQRNGTLAPRIWIVGTKRILGLPPAYGDDPLYLPMRFNRLAWDHYIFADFTVIPLTKDEPGVMRMVRIVSAENIIVTDWKLNFLYRIHGRLKAEENSQPPQPPARGSHGSP